MEKLEPKLSREQLKMADEVFELFFHHVMAEAPAIIEITEQVRSDAVDVRPLLKSAVEAAGHEKTKKPLLRASAEYEKLIGALAECAAKGGELIAFSHDANYRDRLETFSARMTPELVSGEGGARMLLAALKVQGLLKKRYPSWGLTFSSFFSLVEGVDTAQSLLLARTSRLEKLKDFAKAAARDAIGGILPIFSLLVAIAKSQTPQIDIRMDAIVQADNEFDRIFGFEDVVARYLEFSEIVHQLLDQAITEEAHLKEEFQKAFP